MLKKFIEEINTFTEFLKNKYFSARFKLPKIKIQFLNFLINIVINKMFIISINDRKPILFRKAHRKIS
jgi:hypothetical protein